MSVVTVHMVFCAFLALKYLKGRIIVILLPLNYSKKGGELGVGHRQFYSGVNALKNPCQPLPFPMPSKLLILYGEAKPYCSVYCKLCS